MFHELLNALEETLFMVFTASFLAVIVGFPLSVSQVLSAYSSNHSKTFDFNRWLHFIIQYFCSMPYIFIMTALIPLVHWLIRNFENAQTQNGSLLAILPLTLAAIPLFTKSCTDALKQVPKGLVDVAIGLGASPKQLAIKFLIPESLPEIIHGLSQLLIQVLGFTLVVGVLGAGGIGELLMQKGYQNLNYEYIVAIFVSLSILVLLIQTIGNYLAFGKSIR